MYLSNMVVKRTSRYIAGLDLTTHLLKSKEDTNRPRRRGMSTDNMQYIAACLWLCFQKKLNFRNPSNTFCNAVSHGAKISTCKQPVSHELEKMRFIIIFFQKKKISFRHGAVEQKSCLMSPLTESPVKKIRSGWCQHRRCYENLSTRIFVDLIL
jgi:hypothetical protein